MAGQRARELARQRRPRSLKTRFVLFCEGENTEPQYFAALVDLLKLRLVEVESVPAAGSPLGIARKATRWKNNVGQRLGNIDTYDKGDQVWAVFDRDVHENFDAAVKLCEANGINVARSNPCFEIWLILHFQDCHAPLTPKAAQKLLAQRCPEFDPDGRKTVDCRKLIPHLDAAEARAEAHLARRAGEGASHGRSSTTVHLLTRAIRGKT